MTDPRSAADEHTSPAAGSPATGASPSAASPGGAEAEEPSNLQPPEFWQPLPEVPPSNSEIHFDDSYRYPG